MNNEELIAVYTALLETTVEQEEWNRSDISQRAGLELRKTEILLDELEHMGFVEKRDGNWHTRIQLGNDVSD